MTTPAVRQSRQNIVRRGAWRLVASVASALLLMPAFVLAQVRPDSTRRDSVRVELPIPPRDSAAADSAMQARILARSDSIRNLMLGDTIKTPVARFEMPSAALDISERLRFDRNAILSSSAMTLADLLDRVPGVSTFRSGWLAGIHAAAYNGDARRIRYFIDGIEVDGVDTRGVGAIDLVNIPIWTLEDLVIERGAGEIRVWMRTVAATHTTPYSRVDIFTGDLNTNAFRGFVARRWRNGLMFQAGGQQVATQSGRVTAFDGNTGQRLRSDGSVQLFLGRLGWARGKWSVDAYGQGGARDRDRHTSRDTSLFNNLPGYKGSHREGYVRVGYGDTLRGFWSQAMVQSLRVKIEPDTFIAVLDVSGRALPRPDTITARTQQVVAVGYRTNNWAVSLTDRIRPLNGQSVHAPVARGSANWRAFSLGGWVERSGPDSTDRTEVVAQFRPTSWFVVNGSHASRTPVDSSLRIASSSLRAEAAVRYKNIWLSGGVLREDAVRYANIELLNLPGVMLDAPAAQGMLIGARGRLYKDVQFEVQSIRWDTEQFQRPPSTIRADLALISDWRRRFPKGEFSINARISYEMRGGVPFYYGVRGEEEEPDIRVTEKAQVATAHLEIRIQKGTLFYQYRNLSGGQYEQIRGITMPPAVQMYGMRWEFWN
ncbi:MAG TPA: hypothetical protein VGE27_09625 [Gemmatimonas sp.]|uniref:hypothetical protein n=1 Tax=Gemmatimonas sp. TaxID=1962908 RepID=UPI002ED8C2E3